MSTTAISTTTLSSSSDFPKSNFNHPLPLRIPPSFSGGISSRRACSLKLNNDVRQFPTPLAFSGNGNGSGGFSGGDGSGSGSGDDGNDQKEAGMVLPEGSRSSDSFPEMFLELQTSPFSRWLIQFDCIKERLVVDDLILAKVVIQCVDRMVTKTAAEYEKRKEKFSKELEIVYADVGMAVSADFMLAYLRGVAPSLSTNVVAENCPYKAGDTVVTITLINARKMVRTELEKVTGLSPSAGYGLYMVDSGNLRCQLLAGVVERRLRKRLSHKHNQMLSATCYAQVLIENQSNCWIPINISLHLTGVVRHRNWCMSIKVFTIGCSSPSL